MGSRRMSLLIVAWSQGFLEFITDLLQMLSWDMPAHKASFVTKDRTLGQSTPSLTEMLFLMFLALQSWAAWHFGEEQDKLGPRVPIRVVFFTFRGPYETSRNPQMDTTASWNRIPGDSPALSGCLLPPCPSVPGT